MNPEITVTQGAFTLASVHVLVAVKDVLIIEADCTSKYPGELSVSDRGERGPEVMIWPGEHSQKLDQRPDRAAAPTVITLPSYAGNWTVIAEGRRYTIRIVAYSRRRRARLAWQEKPVRTGAASRR
jgi:hypothetical protein